MIRPAVLNDAGPVGDLTVAAGMFTTDEVGFLTELFDQALSGPQDGAHGLIVDLAGDLPRAGRERLVGVAYWRPVEAADGVVDLTMLAVHPDLQGTGRGRALMRHAEDSARRAGQRLMLVQTSGTEQYAGTRRFYAHLGYEQEATVRDYWAAGDDMVLFRLEL